MSAISRRRQALGPIKATIKRERVTEFGKPMGGNPMKQNPALNHSAAREPKFQSPMVAAIKRRRGTPRNSVTKLGYH